MLHLLFEIAQFLPFFTLRLKLYWLWALLREKIYSKFKLFLVVFAIELISMILFSDWLTQSHLVYFSSTLQSYSHNEEWAIWFRCLPIHHQFDRETLRALLSLLAEPLIRPNGCYSFYQVHESWLYCFPELLPSLWVS